MTEQPEPIHAGIDEDDLDTIIEHLGTQFDQVLQTWLGTEPVDPKQVYALRATFLLYLATDLFANGTEMGRVNGVLFMARLSEAIHEAE